MIVEIHISTHFGVTIPDDNLRAALEQELGKGEGAPKVVPVKSERTGMA